MKTLRSFWISLNVKNKTNRINKYVYTFKTKQKGKIIYLYKLRNINPHLDCYASRSGGCLRPLGPCGAAARACAPRAVLESSLGYLALVAVSFLVGTRPV